MLQQEMTECHSEETKTLDHCAIIGGAEKLN